MIDYGSDNYLMTDFGHFMFWCAKNKKEFTPENFVEFVEGNETFDHSPQD